MNNHRLIAFGRITLLITFNLSLLACGGGGGSDIGGIVDSTNNLSTTELRVETPDPRIGYPLNVSVSITADKAADDVGVSLFAVENNQNPATVTRQIPLGTQTIPRIEAGAGSYELEINIPSSVQLPGDYFIAAIVNPVNEVAETAEADNIASTETTLEVPDSPNILLQQVVLDRTVLDINTSTYQEQVPGAAENVHNSDAGGTITIGADGLEVNETIDLEAYARLRLMRSDKGTSYDVPLYLWNSDDPATTTTDEGRYTNAFGFDPADPQVCDIFGCSPVIGSPEWLPIGQFQPQLVETVGDEIIVDDVNRTSVHLDFYFPGKLGRELEIAMRHLVVSLSDPNFPPPDLTPADIQDLRDFLFNLPVSSVSRDYSAALAVMSFAICVEIRPADPAVVDRSPADNGICSPLAITLPPIPDPPPVPVIPYSPVYTKSTAPQLFDGGYRSKWETRVFGYGVDFNASSSADDRGLIVNLHGSVPVTIFGNTLGDLVKFDGRAQALPAYAGSPVGDPGFTLQLRFADQVLMSVDEDPAITITVPIKTLFSKEKRFPEPNPQLAPGQVTCKLRFPVGPVSLCLEAFVKADIGINYEIGFLGNGFTQFIGPEATLEAGAEGFAAIPFLQGGVRGVVSLLDEKFGLTGSATLDVINSGSGGIAELVIERELALVNELTTASGRIEAFARYEIPTMRRCSWGFFTGVCPGFSQIEAKIKLHDFGKAWTKKDVLFNKSAIIDVVVEAGRPPEYYTQ